MAQQIFLPNLLRRCDDCCGCTPGIKANKEKYCQAEIGYFQVEHNHGNTNAYCHFDSFVYNQNKYPESRYYMSIYEFTGKKAIQNVLEFMQNYPVDHLIDQIIKYRFYNRSYMDYQGVIDNV
jgi:hypothetical protein